MPTPPADSLDIQAATAVAASALAAGDKVPVDDISANAAAGGWVAVELQTLLDALLKLAAAADCVLTVDGTGDKLVFRERGGTADVDEIQFSYSGSVAGIANVSTSGSNRLRLGAADFQFMDRLFNGCTFRIQFPGILQSNSGYFAIGSGDPNSVACDISLYRVAAGVFGVGAGGASGGGAMEFAEIAAPGAGAANTARLYAEDNGSGKTRVVAKFADGSTAVVATQP